MPSHGPPLALVARVVSFERYIVPETVKPVAARVESKYSKAPAYSLFATPANAFKPMRVKAVAWVIGEPIFVKLLPVLVL